MNETVLKSFADEMATNGMLAAGYQYINLDDGWPGYRDTNGVMVADTNKFPSGMKALADYLHAKGFQVRAIHHGGHQYVRGFSRRGESHGSGCEHLCFVGGGLLEVRRL